jgi:hypothetical protein
LSDVVRWASEFTGAAEELYRLLVQSLADRLMVGTIADIPAVAGSADAIRLYWAYDTNELWVDDGAWQLVGGGGSASFTDEVSVTFDGGGLVISSGKQARKTMRYSGTLVGWYLIGDQAGGSIVIDVWKDVWTNYPPTAADTICGGSKPTLSSANKASGGVSGWTTAITAGDVLLFNVDSVSGHTQVNLVLEVSR